MARSARSYHEEAEQLRARGWTYREIVARWRDRHGFNSRVAFRLAHGMTQADVAQRWNEQWPDSEAPKTGKQISYWEIWPGSAGRAPSAETLDRLAFLYRCSAGDLLDGADYSHLDSACLSAAGFGDLGQAKPQRQSSMADATGSTISRVTEPVVADLEELTHTYRKVDYRDGSRRVTAEVASHLRLMLDVSNRTVSSRAHRRLLLATGDAAQLAAWLAIDAQRYDQARGYCQLAMSLAEKANDRALLAYSFGIVGYIHLHAGDGQAALRVLTNAGDIAGRGLPPAVGSWLREAAGEAHGLLNQSSRGLTALAQAERAFDRVTPDNTPAWLSFFNSACHAARLKGRCLTRLHQPEEAIRALYEGLTLLPQSFVRERSGTLIDLAQAYIQLKEIEKACDVAGQADDLACQTGSLRNRQRLRTLLVDLLPWASLDCVQRLFRQVLLN